MANTHHHHHHHHHHHDGGDAALESPLDAANQSLADALRASFSILKFIMLLLVFAYLFSGVKCIEESQQAVVLRFGKLLPGVREPGLSWAFPPPIDETVALPAKKDNSFRCLSHWPKIKPTEVSLPLSQSRAAGGLNPTHDGSLLTADRGLVHIQWAIRYRVDDLRSYVRYVDDVLSEEDDDDQSKIQTLITDLVRSGAVSVVSKYSAEAVTRAKTSDIATELRGWVNDRLTELNTGVVLVGLDIPRSSVPGQTIAAFSDVTNAENQKQKEIRDAQQKRNEILNQAAGAAHEELITLLDELEAAEAANDITTATRLNAAIESLLTTRAGGNAGLAIGQANAYYTQVVQQVEGDLDQYLASLDEYKTNPEMFIHRMWQQTRERVLQSDDVKKHFLPGLVDEIRIRVAPDPRQREIDEKMRLRKEVEKYDFNKVRRHLQVGEG